VALLDADHINGETIAEIIERDLKASPDLLLVLGTSLRVPGPTKLACMFARVVRKKGGTVVYTNLSQPSHSWGHLVDYVVKDSCDSWVADLKGRSIPGRVKVRSCVGEAGKQRGRETGHHGRAHKKRIYRQRIMQENKQDGSAEHPFTVD
jgi:hypothetical protein